MQEVISLSKEVLTIYGLSHQKLNPKSIIFNIS